MSRDSDESMNSFGLFNDSSSVSGYTASNDAATKKNWIKEIWIRRGRNLI
jgi:hypothetical protein